MSSAANGNRKKSTFAENRKKTELEEQVSDLKKRLEELRKAKSTTIIKKDKTYVASGAPHKLCDNATKQTAELHDSHRQGTASLESTEKNEEGSQQDSDSTVAVELEKITVELEKISKQNAELLEENEKLKLKTTELELRVKTSWGEKYQKWMAQTEQKIEELTAANNFL
ncbi:hypothetical protein P5673_001098 [Acropora cervicornis]|uniref:Uncharacterized protein n=1 Tax=Acropora cervicornis TaxID=6130 RepID=A0AAD9R5L3_ACRCE|nr:hypothetical protein P5673_001098 [Acropora cervicornis]